MTQQEYKIGDTIYWLSYSGDCLEIEHDVITKIDKQYYYFGKHGIGKDHILYPSRDVLIDAQIAYWTSLKNGQKST